jgi:translation elongation factor EF-Tu-like GTPase
VRRSGVPIETGEIEMRERIWRLSCAVMLAVSVGVGYGAAAGVTADRDLPGLAVDEAFGMTVADVFTITGKGVVVTGRIESGTVSVGDEACLTGKGGTRTVTINGIEHFREVRESAKAGDDVGLLLDGVEKSDVAKKDRLNGGKC